MTITLDNRPEIPLHPLDLTTPTSQSASCIGIIQAYPAGSKIQDIADIILGVPFMRSTYTVMAYDQPDSSGNFPGSSTSSNLIRPRLGLMGLTDPAVALDEFNTVRVLKQPLGTGGANGGAQGKSAVDDSGGKKISVGIAVLIGLLGFFALCFVLFTARWAYARRKYRRERAGGDAGGANGSGDSKTEEQLVQEVAYRLARRSSRSDPYGPSEDTLRALRYSEYRKRRELGSSGVDSDYTDDTGRTRVGLVDGKDKYGVGEFGGIKGSDSDLGGDTLHRRHDSEDSGDGVEGDVGVAGMMTGVAGYRAVKTHNRSDSESSTELRRESSALPPRSHTTNSIPDEYFPHRQSQHAPSLHHRTASGEPNSSAPLLSHTRSDSYIPNLPHSPDQSSFGYSDHRRTSSRMSRISRLPPPMPLDLPTADDSPAPLPYPPRPHSARRSSKTGSTISPPPLARLPPEGNLLGSPLPGQAFDLSSREDVIHSNQGTSGHGQLS